jgi:regulator of protease activity HflC (stomatin/prohibitin superfamily)
MIREKEFDLAYGDDEVRPGAAALTIVGIIAVIVGIVLGIGFMTGFEKVPVGQMGLSYGGGPFESNHFQGVKTPGDGRFFNGLADHLVMLPTTTKNYLVTSDQGRGDRAGTSDVIWQPTQSVNGQPGPVIGWEFNAAFRLNDNSEIIKNFWQTVGIKYGADDCPTDSADCKGWDTMLDKVVRPQLENALRDVSAGYKFADLYGNAANQQAALEKVGEDLKNNINAVAGGEFFCGPKAETCEDIQLTLSRLDAPQQIKDVSVQQQVAAAQLQVQRNNAQAAVEQAKAIKEVAAALQEAGPNYVLLQILKEHPEKLPELWVVPNNTNVNVNKAAQ